MKTDSVQLDYWCECLSNAAEEVGLSLTKEQLTALAEAAENGHENYGQAFYSPPATDMFYEQERKHNETIKKLKKEFTDYQHNAETAVKQALGQYSDSQVSIGEYGEVTRYDGRITRIQ